MSRRPSLLAGLLAMSCAPPRAAAVKDAPPTIDVEVMSTPPRLPEPEPRGGPSCAPLLERVDRVQALLQTIVGGGPDDLRHAAADLEEAGARIGTTWLSDAKLRELRDQHAALTLELAAALRQTAATLERGDGAGAQEAAQQVSTLRVREHESAVTLQRRCALPYAPRAPSPRGGR